LINEEEKKEEEEGRTTTEEKKERKNPIKCRCDFNTKLRIKCIHIQ
jgi:hypothetical protein